MGSSYTELSPQDKGKILAYMENFNATQIAKKMGRDPTTIRRFINKYQMTGSIKIYHDQDGYLLLKLLKKMHS